MHSHDREASEFSGAARRLSASLLEGVHLRLDLFALELAEERRRLREIVLGTLAAALAGFMVFLCANAALLIVFWEEHRIPVVLGMCGFYALLAGLVAVVIGRRAQQASRPFPATREILEADRRGLRDPS